jgi:hypothetical protein
MECMKLSNTVFDYFFASLKVPSSLSNQTPFDNFVLAAGRRRLAGIQTLEVRQSIWKNELEKVRYLCIDTSVDRKNEQLVEDRSE